MTESAPAFLRGGSFLIRPLAPGEMFVPEDFDAEQLMYAKTARDFVANEVLPALEEIEAKNLAVSRKLLAKAGELGLLMGDIPEQYGGLGLDKASCTLIAENMSGLGSFQTMWMVQTGIGSLPIVYYGTEAQREKYLPGLAEGSLIGAYCLTEPSAGSDAMSARTRAVLSEDGTHYVLNGVKQFITNGGLADVFTVFAKIDGEKFTAFLLEKGTPGLKIGPEEHKLGIRGSTTTTVILEDARVPAENVLGVVGQGHKIAFNILNVGRFKLGICAVGSAKWALRDALAYTLERKQFGKRLAEFGAIREKLAQMFVRTYAAESLGYRTIGLVDRLLAGSGDRYGEAALQSIEEYNVECAMTKVACSEALDYVADQTLQCMGGYGFCAEYPAERYYRDSRINRIYEGTNEICRVVVASMLLRRAGSGELPLFDAAGRVLAEPPASAPDGLLGAETALVENVKRISLAALGSATRKYGKALGGHQPVLLRLADLATEAYVAESTLCRALRAVERRGAEAALLPVAAARIACEEAMDRAESLARQCLVSLGDDAALAKVAQLAARAPADTLSLRESIAAKLVEMERVVY